jgi:hypothetical protein
VTHAGSTPVLLAQIADEEMIELVTPGSLRIRVQAWRLKPLAATLIDLFDGFLGGNSLRLSRFDAPRLANSTTAVAGSSGAG